MIGRTERITVNAIGGFLIIIGLNLFSWRAIVVLLGIFMWTWGDWELAKR